MKRRVYLSVASIVLLMSIGFGMRAQTQKTDVERWEYQTLYGTPYQLPGYNQYGQQGWELTGVACQDNLNQCAFFFKRRR